MKKAWVEPRIEVQKFVPQEYCAVCPRSWKVACDWVEANKVEQKWENTDPNNGFSNNFLGGQTHGENQCGSYDKQMLVDTDGDLKPDKMWEIKTEGHGDLFCTFYTDARYSETIELKNIDLSKKIYWINSLDNGRTWHHQGWASETSSGYNHS